MTESAQTRSAGHADARVRSGSAALPLASALSDLAAYQLDLWQRSVFYLDALRQRAENMLAYERAGQQEEPRAKILLEYLAAHEASLESTVASFERQADPKALHTWV